MSNTNQNSEKPTVKAKGPLRTEAVIPIAIIFVCTYFYFHLFFDSHIRKLAEWTAGSVHGAEVNIGQIKTSFLGGSFRMTDLQITDKEQPERNLLEIGEIRFGFMWDALLRMKFVVNDAGIDQIQVFSPRKTKGWVKPPEPPSTEPSAMAKLESNVLEQTKSEYEGNVLSDVAKLLEGTDEKELVNQIRGDLKSEAKIKELEEDMKKKEAEWKERVDKLPQKEELESLVKRAKALKFDTKNPKQFADDLKEAQKIVKEADKKYDDLKDTTDALKTDVAKYEKEIKGLNELIDQDLKDIQKRMNLPELDGKDFSKNLFTKMFADKLGSLQKYMEIGRKVMPPPKDPNQKDEALIPPARGQGKNFRFPITTGYPLFWLKNATISSKATDQGFSGNIEGSLTDVTTSPDVIGKPAVLTLKGDFPKAQVLGTKLSLTMDHIAEPKETLELVVGQFPVLDQKLLSNGDTRLGLASAKGASNFHAVLANQQLEVDMKNEFTDLKYDLEAKNKTVNEAVSQILAGIPVVTVDGEARGSWNDLSLHLRSNLGNELSEGLKKYVEEKVKAARDQIKKTIDERVGAKRDELEAKQKEFKNKIDGVLKNKKDELDKTKADVKNSSGDKKSAAQDKAKKDLKEKGKKLLKGIKF